MTKTLPQKAREFRAALDSSNMPTTYVAPEGRGMSQPIWVYPPNGKKFLVLVEHSRYAIFPGGYDEIHKTDFAEAVELVKKIYNGN